jgi:hypothetical protein
MTTAHLNLFMEILLLSARELWSAAYVHMIPDPAPDTNTRRPFSLLMVGVPGVE